ncbi:MAG TPA: fasciclin domain-containing protein [Streptosporangiaceae bacterium]|nr:fasciclin domain-containing protein [Streptosporangiaceae bacterium]
MRSNLSQAVKRFHGVTAGAMLGIVSLAAAACGGTASTASAGTMSTHQPTPPAVTTSAHVGTDCGMFPSTGMSSMHSLSMDKLLTAAGHDRRLSRLISAATRSGLTADLNSMHPLTLVAPVNSAFAHVPKMTAGLLRNKTELTKILRYHVVAAPISPAQMARGIRVSTLEGSALRFSKAGSVYKVNGATVLCGNIQTANATIYIINKVLTPPK